MTRIDVASALSAVLKSQPDLVNRASAVSGGAVTTPKKPEERGTQAKIENGTALQLEPNMLHRMRAIAEDDPQRRRKVFRIFMESVLLKQLGMSLGGDAEFTRIVDRVLQQIDEDPGLRESSFVAADILIEQSRDAV